MENMSRLANKLPNNVKKSLSRLDFVILQGYKIWHNEDNFLRCR